MASARIYRPRHPSESWDLRRNVPPPPPEQTPAFAGVTCMEEAPKRMETAPTDRLHSLPQSCPKPAHGEAPHGAWPAVSGTVFHSGWREPCRCTFQLWMENQPSASHRRAGSHPLGSSRSAQAPCSRFGGKLPWAAGAVLEEIDVPRRKLRVETRLKSSILSLSFARPSFREIFLPSRPFRSGAAGRARETHCRRRV